MPPSQYFQGHEADGTIQTVKSNEVFVILSKDAVREAKRRDHFVRAKLIRRRCSSQGARESDLIPIQGVGVAHNSRRMRDLKVICGQIFTKGSSSELCSAAYRVLLFQKSLELSQDYPVPPSSTTIRCSMDSFRLFGIACSSCTSARCYFPFAYEIEAISSVSTIVSFRRSGNRLLFDGTRSSSIKVNATPAAPPTLFRAVRSPTAGSPAALITLGTNNKLPQIKLPETFSVNSSLLPSLLLRARL